MSASGVTDGNDPQYVLPVSITSRLEGIGVQQEASRPTLLITGAAGVVGRVTARALHDRFRVAGLDVAPAPEDEPFDDWYQCSVADRGAVLDATRGCQFVLHAATGASSGWDGLRSVEIDGTRNVLDSAAETGITRVVLCSSNHVTGFVELDRLLHGSAARARPTDPVRPDGLYAAAKVFLEGLARAHSEYSGLQTSLIRMGAMRLKDDPDALSDDPSFAYLGDSDAVIQRMQAVWLSHDAWTKVLCEELGATETFRLRYASMTYHQAPWSEEVLTWSRPSGHS